VAHQKAARPAPELGNEPHQVDQLGGDQLEANQTKATNQAPTALRSVLETACEKHGLNQSDLTVLSKGVDPYRLDTPAGHRDGSWGAEQLRRFYPADRQAHWRGLHYALIMAKKKVRKPSGEDYQNTEEDWDWLQGKVGKAARWLGYIPFDRIKDERNAAPIIHRHQWTVPEAYLSIGLSVGVPDVDDIDPRPTAHGFEVRQASHFVIFGEKSSLEEILDPIAAANQADLYLVSGEISDTLIHQIAKDAYEDGRPLVVFTVSDCDPAGYQMPVSIARKLQAFRDLFFPDLRFEVVPVALTPDQVRAFQLPEEPLKKGEKRKDRWKEAFGVEQTEVDALTNPEMVERGVLAQIVQEAFDRYIDPTLNARVRRAHEAWEGDAQAAIDEQIDQGALHRIREEAAFRLDELQAEIERINQQLDLSTNDFELPPIDVPESEIELDDDRQALVRFDDDWVTATQKLKARKNYGNGSTDEEGA
jgi:hypothetical protein